MLQVQRALSFFRVADNDPELILSQFRAVCGQIPLLYVGMLLNTMAVSATHIHYAPVALTVIVPGVVIAVCVLRIITWRRLGRTPIDAPRALHILRRTIGAAAGIAIVSLTWSFLLFPYGNNSTRCQLELFDSITVICGIFCLMQLRPAALLVALITVPTAAIFFTVTGEPVLIAIAVDSLLVSICMVVVLSRHYTDFASLSYSRKEVMLRQIETQRLSDENSRLANIDTLTNLANRRGFFRELAAVLERSRSAQQSAGIGLIDLDGFKPINDVFGHVTGDAVLHEVGRRLAGMAGPSVSFARLGGDEFGFVLSGGPDAGIVAFAERVCEALRAPYVVAEATAELSASIGLATLPQAGQTVSQLFEHADYALYHAKQNRRGAPVVFSPLHRGEIREAAQIEQALRHAEIETEISLAIQPIFDCDTRRTVAFECLARWISPTLGVVEPTAFIKAAERSDMINRLTQTLLRRALADMRQWPEDVGISFNLSVRDIASEESVRKLCEIVAASGVRAGRISFEITETAVMRDFAQARLALQIFRGMGAHISLDDFGTGYSSLSYVHKLPLDRIKVDRSFTADLESDPASRNIIKTVLGLCANLGLCCVVEGLETEAQVLVLRGLGCSLMQGYIFARGMPAAQIAGFLAAERPDATGGRVWASPWAAE